MTHGISKRYFLAGGISALAAGVAFADAPGKSLRPRARGGDFHKRAVRGPKDLIRDAKLNGHVAYAVADAKTGARLEANAPHCPSRACVRDQSSYGVICVGPVGGRASLSNPFDGDRICIKWCGVR